MTTATATATSTAKSTVKIGKTTTMHLHAFLYISLPSLQDHKVKLFNFTFFGGLEHKAATSFFVSWTSKKCLIIELQKKFANIWRVERDGISVIKFEAARIHFPSDVFVAARRACRCCLSSIALDSTRLAIRISAKRQAIGKNVRCNGWIPVRYNRCLGFFLVFCYPLAHVYYKAKIRRN